MHHNSKREMLLAMLNEHRRKRRNRMSNMGWEKETSPVWKYHDWAMIWERQLEAAYQSERDPRGD